MLKQVAEGVHVHESEFCQSNAVVVEGPTGVLLIDAGVSADELDYLAHDLSTLGQGVVVGFSTHPHWDHMLWHTGFGAVPRYSTARAAAFARERLSGDIHAIAKADGIPENVPLDLMGQITGRPRPPRFPGMALESESSSIRPMPRAMLSCGERNAGSSSLATCFPMSLSRCST